MKVTEKLFNQKIFYKHFVEVRGMQCSIVFIPSTLFPISIFWFFLDNTVKQYDMEPLIRSIPAFQILEEPVLFNQVRVDAGGYGVTWNDNLDLSCNELWEKGEIVQ